MLKVKFCPFAIALASKWKGRSDGASAEDRVEQLKGLREPLHVLCRASVTEGNIPGEMRGTLQPHRGPADDHEFNARVVKNADRLFELHCLFCRDCFAIWKMWAPSERLRARSVGVRRRVERNKVKSTPNSFALASSLPGGGLVTKSNTAFSWSLVIGYEYMFSYRQGWFNFMEVVRHSRLRRFERDLFIPGEKI